MVTVISAALFTSCAKPDKASEPETQASQAQGPKEELPDLPPPPAEPVSEFAPNLSAPKEGEIHKAINRILGSLVEIPAGSDLLYVYGDFNGDESQDIAVVVRPAQGSIEEINSELANWTLDDPTIPSQLDPNKATQPLPPHPAPVRFEQTDFMLAIIHGYGPEGWRNQEAKQTYLLRHAVGSGMKTQSLKSSLGALKTREGMPRLRGDVIGQSLNGETGFIYWAGGRYAWHPPAKVASR